MAREGSMDESKFGWSLPAGCGTLPGEEPDAYEAQMAHRCKCGAFLRAKEDRSKGYTASTPCDGSLTASTVAYLEGESAMLNQEDGDTYDVWYAPCGAEFSSKVKHKPHEDVYAAGTLCFHDCRRCGYTTQVDN